MYRGKMDRGDTEKERRSELCANMKGKRGKARHSSSL